MSSLNLNILQQGIASGRASYHNVNQLGWFVGKETSDVEIIVSFLEERRQGPLKRQGMIFIIEFAVEAPILAFIRSRATHDATVRQLLHWLRVDKRQEGSEVNLTMPFWAWLSMLTLSQLERWEDATEAKEQNYEVYKRCVMISMYVINMVRDLPLDEELLSEVPGFPARVDPSPRGRGDQIAA